MSADAQPRSGGRGQQLLLEDIRRVDDLQKQGRTCARDRLEAALGADVARRLLGALVPRRPRPLGDF